MKLLEKLRWLPTEMPWPGTAEVSAKSWLLRGVGGRDAGNQQREIEKIAAVQRQVADLGLRHGAGDLAARRLEHRRLAGDRDVGRRSIPTASETGRSNAEPTVSVRVRVTSANPCWLHLDLVRPDLEVRKAETALLVGQRGADRFVSVCRAVTCAPLMTPPEGSVTRPLTLA